MRIIVNTAKYNANRTAEQSNETMTLSLRELGGKVYFFFLTFDRSFSSVLYILSWFFPSCSKFLAGIFLFLVSRTFFFYCSELKPCLRFNVSVWVTVESSKVGLALEAVSMKKPSLGSLWWQKHPTGGLFWRVSAGVLKQELRFLIVFKCRPLTCMKLSLWNYLSADQTYATLMWRTCMYW